jgi:hypothetical protein
MTLDEYEKLPPEEQEHFARCEKCGEMLDRAQLGRGAVPRYDHKPKSGHTVFWLGKAEIGHSLLNFLGAPTRACERNGFVTCGLIGMLPACRSAIAPAGALQCGDPTGLGGLIMSRA